MVQKKNILSLDSQKDTIQDWSVDGILDLIIDRFEGSGFVNHPDDHGGPTRFGITKLALSRYRDEAVRTEDIRNLRRREAKSIYSMNYVTPVRGADISHGPLRLAMIDWSINSGPSRAARAMQEIVGVSVDGIIGPVTMGEMQKHEPQQLFLHLMAARIVFVAGLVSRDHTQAAFILGWGRRLGTMLELAG